jgi:hypothetical protein
MELESAICEKRSKQMIKLLLGIGCAIGAAGAIAVLIGRGRLGSSMQDKPSKIETVGLPESEILILKKGDRGFNAVMKEYQEQTLDRTRSLLRARSLLRFSVFVINRLGSNYVDRWSAIFGRHFRGFPTQPISFRYHSLRSRLG